MSSSWPRTDMKTQALIGSEHTIDLGLTRTEEVSVDILLAVVAVVFAVSFLGAVMYAEYRDCLTQTPFNRES